MMDRPLMVGEQHRPSSSFELERVAGPTRSQGYDLNTQAGLREMDCDDDPNREQEVPNEMERESSRLPSLRFTVIEVPPWHVCLILGFQHYLTMLGSTVVIPALLVPAMGGSASDQARVVQTIFFVSGINTLIQTTIGDRLPIVQGGSFSFLKPAFSIIAIIQASRTFPSEHERFMYTMRELQGSIIGSSLLVMVIGYSGAMGALLRFVSPLVVAATVCMVGLSLYGVGFSGVADCVEQGLMAIVAVILFSQVLKRVEVPLPRGVLSRPPSSAALLAPGSVGGGAGGGGGGGGGLSSAAVTGALARSAGQRHGGSGGVRIFELFPLLWSILLCWGVAGILTASGVYDNTTPERRAACRTDNMTAVAAAPWLYVPYPLQWGTPIFRPASIVTMAAGALAAMIESTGDYYACARMCGAPVPPPYVISRGIGAEGLGCFMCGLFGTGNGTTSYAENIGAIGLTGVGSRRVVQAGAAIMILLAVLGKFGALFASLPTAIVAGLFCCVFGLIAAVGLSNLQFTDQNSSRNLMVVGFAIYMALSVPHYFDTYTAAHGGTGPIATSSQHVNDILNTLFSTPMCVALLIALLLDNVIAGSPEERGLIHWSVLAGTPASGQQQQQNQRPTGSENRCGGPGAARHGRRQRNGTNDDTPRHRQGFPRQCRNNEAQSNAAAQWRAVTSSLGGNDGGAVAQNTDGEGAVDNVSGSSLNSETGGRTALLTAAARGSGDVQFSDYDEWRGAVTAGGRRGAEDAMDRWYYEDTDDSDDEEDEDDSADPRSDPRIKAVYDLPYVLQAANERYILPYRRAAHRGLRRLGRGIARWWRRWVRWMRRACCGCSKHRSSQGSARMGADGGGDLRDAHGAWTAVRNDGFSISAEYDKLGKESAVHVPVRTMPSDEEVGPTPPPRQG